MNNDPQQVNKGELLTVDISEVVPIGFNAKYYNNTQKEYKVSRGKTHLFRRSLLLIFIGLVVSIVSIKTLPDQLEGDWSWLSPLLWLPRLAALIFVFMAYMRIKEMRKIKDLYTFSAEGIQYGDQLIPWEEVEKIEASYYAASDDIFDLIISHSGGRQVLDVKNVDEFSEDVAAVLHKYYRKYKVLPGKRT